MKKAPKFLFTSVFTPFPKKSIEDDNIDFFYYRNSLYQGIFQMRQMDSHHPLHYLAQNIPCDSIVMENYPLKDILQIIKKNQIDVVCITFVVPTAPKVLILVKEIKTLFPSVDIILGGYGTGIFSYNDGIEKEIEKYTDYICREEGVQFTKNYLKNKWDVAQELPKMQDFIPSKVGFYRSGLTIATNLHVVMALGCNNHCSFCATSGQFKNKLYLLNAKELYDQIRKRANDFPSAKSIMIYNENFLEDKEMVMEFKSYMEKDKELAERPLKISIFTSVKSLVQYTPEDLVKCNIGLVFIGVESFSNSLLSEENLDKRGALVSNVFEVFESLHSVGINTIGSLVIGWDSHTLQTAEIELDNFVKLNPSMYQIIPLQALPGTPLWDRIIREGRLKKDFSYDTMKLQRSSFEFKNFTQDESMKMILGGYKRMVAEGGPWIFRFFENLLKGYAKLTSSGDESFKPHIKGYKRLIKTYMPVIYIVRLFFHGANFKKRWKTSIRTAFKIFPFSMFFSFFLSILLFPFLLAISFSGIILHTLSKNGEQPDKIYRHYKPRYKESQE